MTGTPLRGHIKYDKSEIAKNENSFVHVTISYLLEAIRMPAEIEEYNGNPVICLKRDKDDAYPFRFGLRKAQLIIDHIDEIKKFVKEGTK